MRLASVLVLGGGLAVAAGIGAYAATPKPGSAIQGQAGPAADVAVQKSGPGAGLPVLAKGRPAPGFSLPRLGGGPPVSLAGFRGHPVVLNFFASWCTDCRAELRAFAEVSNARHGPVRFLAVDTNDRATGEALALLRKAGDRYPVGTDPSATVANGAYLVEALPVTVFIRADGRIAGEAFGAQTVGSLGAWVRALAVGAGQATR